MTTSIAFNDAYCSGHAKRFALSMQIIGPRLADGGVVYDFGQGVAGCPFNQEAKRRYPNVDLRDTGSADLRYPLDVAEGIADGVLAMEIVEHMRDRDDDPIDTFSGSGAKNLLVEAFRILRPGGWLFLTTPNGSQYGCAWRLVSGHGSRWVDDHVREFGWWEIQRDVEAAGFKIESATALDVYESQFCDPALKLTMDFLRPNVPRGDCIFIIAIRPSADHG
jgi:hypothetical protein